jgi:adenylosuccinate lyase
MDISKLNAISPLDGRYWNQCEELSAYFSEAALIRYRLLVEVEYFIALAEFSVFKTEDGDAEKLDGLRKLYSGYSEKYGEEIKETERTTNHDVKAVEYFLKKKAGETGLGALKEFIHFGLTSQDINNTAFPLAIKNCVQDIYFPQLAQVIRKLNELSNKWNDIPMLSRTHGQPASPTRLGKELMVFVERLNNQLVLVMQVPFSAKFGGASGNFNAHHAAYPKTDWKKFADNFITSLGLKRLQFTTQIEHYDNLCALFDGMKRINNILVDFNRDVWTYVSMDYFKQEVKEGEIGSSAMPHKINPIDFENSEGNLGMANALFEYLSAKLPISRLQRDLTDSTVLRNVGVPFGHTLIAMKSLLKGLDKLIVNTDAIHADLENNWSVIAEAIQTILRRENYPNPYEKLKELTRTNKKITKENFADFIQKLDVKDETKQELMKITPFNYTGI